MWIHFTSFTRRASNKPLKMTNTPEHFRLGLCTVTLLFGSLPSTRGFGGGPVNLFPAIQCKRFPPRARRTLAFVVRGAWDLYRLCTW